MSRRQVRPQPVFEQNTNNLQDQTKFQLNESFEDYFNPQKVLYESKDTNEAPAELEYPPEPIESNLQWDDVKDKILLHMTDNYDYQNKQFKIKSTLEEDENDIQIFVSWEDRHEGQQQVIFEF